MISHPRFWKKTEVSTEHSCNGTPCIDWTGAKNPQGYGRHYFDGKPWNAHRLSYVFNHGNIPDGMCVCHHCDRPCCVNPEHLYAGTKKDNAQDRLKRGRQSTRVGNANGKSVLNPESVKLIRQFLQRHKPVVGHSGGSLTFLARWFGVTKSHIGNVQKGRSWKHITLEGATS